MATTGLREFKEVLKNFKELGALALKGTVALPLISIWVKFGPPPSGAISMLTSAAEFLAVMWSFHFWYGASIKALNRRMKWCAVVFCGALMLSGVLIEQFTTRPGPGKDSVVEGYTLLAQIKPLIGPSYGTIDALHDAEFDPFRVWTGGSILVVHTLLVTSWLITFVSISCFVSIFLMVQRKRRVN